ncbi:MAG TPA: DUF4838 domain-containing protein [Tepidisphaeraceae bacterium]|nr:DUF4838 domain-containing protein [Tepidisphaeraceae bacterium]
MHSSSDNSARLFNPCAAALLLLLSSRAIAANLAPPTGQPPAKFRDLKVYTTSAPDPADASRIVATMKLLNGGAHPLYVNIALNGNEAAGCAATSFAGRVEAGKDATWNFDLRPPEGLTYEVLKGTISFGEEAAAPDRELYIAVHGPDPADFADPRVERISARAQVVATHAPRTEKHIQRLTDAPEQKADSGGLVIATRGASPFRIAMGAPDAASGLAEAVADLQRCVEIKSGAKLPLVAAAEAGPAIRIRRMPAPSGWPNAEAYRMRTINGELVIEATTDEGLRNGVYGLLTDHLDCHWFMPKQLGEEIVVPSDRSVYLASIDETRAPSFSSSIGMSWGSAPRWDRQNRSIINRGRMNFGHAWAGFIDRNLYPFDKFPDMWSRDRAGNIQVSDSTWSSTNFCSTSPEVIRIVAEKINAHFDANPDAIVASIDPNDLAPLCQCDRCLALDASYGVTPQDDKQMADRLVHFSKEVHDRLKPEHKQKYLGVLAYGLQTRPPKRAVPHPYHATTVCDFPYYFDHTRPFNDPTSSYNREFAAIVKGWAAAVKQLGFYDYYGHFDFFGPWGIVHKMREDLPAFRDAGGTFIVIESQPNFSMNGLNLYVAARLVWDVDADVDVLVEEYVTKFYGPAAEPMRAFFRGAERHYALTRPGVQAAQRVGARLHFWSELDDHLQRAEALTRGLSGADQRFADRIAFHRDGFAFGRLAFELPTRASDQEFRSQTKAQFDRMKAKYTASDAYWPTMIAPYFYPEVDLR